MSFTMTNNSAEYEAFLAGLQIAKDIWAKRVKICTDSQLVASQVTYEYQVSIRKWRASTIICPTSAS